MALHTTNKEKKIQGMSRIFNLKVLNYKFSQTNLLFSYNMTKTILQHANLILNQVWDWEWFQVK